MSTTSPIKLPNPATWGNMWIGSHVRRYDVFMWYNASGSGSTTTGSATTGSPTVLNVASSGVAATFYTGQGIFIAGAGAAGANLVSAVSSVSGSTINLTVGVSTTVSGVLVQHDDTVAINAAIADAFNNGGGKVFFSRSCCDGIYRCSAPANGTTGGILTFPQNLTYENPVTVELVGECLGIVNQTDDLSVQYGCALDFSNAPNVTGTHGISAAASVGSTALNYTTIFNSLNVVIENLLIFMPNQSKVNGLMLRNAMQASIGDHVYIITKPDSANTWSSPTGASVGVWMPQWLNNVILNVGSAVIGTFNVNIVPGEHTRFNKPYLVYSNAAMYFYHTQDLVTGSVTIETSVSMIQVDASVSQAIPLDLNIDSEVTTSGGAWYSRGANDIIDTSNWLSGKIDYKIVNSATNPQIINLSGASNLNVKSLYDAPVYSAAGVPLPSASAVRKGYVLQVSDATTPTYLGAYVSGGSVAANVISTGSGWVTC